MIEQFIVLDILYYLDCLLLGLNYCKMNFLTPTRKTYHNFTASQFCTVEVFLARTGVQLSLPMSKNQSSAIVKLKFVFILIYKCAAVDTLNRQPL